MPRLLNQYTLGVDKMSTPSVYWLQSAAWLQGYTSINNYFTLTQEGQCYMPNDSDNKLGLLLKELLKKQSLSIRGMDKLSGIDAATISRIINGKRKATPAHLQRLADCLNVPVSSLFAAAGYSDSNVHSDLLESVATIEEVLHSSNYSHNFSLDRIEQELARQREFAQTKEGKETILLKFTEKIKDIGASGPFIQHLQRMYDRFRLNEGSAFELALYAGALLYFIMPFDCIPDYMFPIGYIDDAIAVNLVLNAQSNL